MSRTKRPLGLQPLTVAPIYVNRHPRIRLCHDQRVPEWGQRPLTEVGSYKIVIVFLSGLAADGQYSSAAAGGRALLITFLLGAGYAALRVLGTAIVFRRVRYLIAGRIDASASPLEQKMALWAARVGALLLIGMVGFWAFDSQNMYQFAVTGVPSLAVLLLFSGMFWREEGRPDPRPAEPAI
jgi:hypothetical protein